MGRLLFAVDVCFMLYAVNRSSTTRYSGRDLSALFYCDAK